MLYRMDLWLVCGRGAGELQLHPGIGWGVGGYLPWRCVRLCEHLHCLLWEGLHAGHVQGWEGGWVGHRGRLQAYVGQAGRQLAALRREGRSGV